jgi:hypothetical protein
MTGQIPTAPHTQDHEKQVSKFQVFKGSMFPKTNLGSALDILQPVETLKPFTTRKRACR